VAKVAVARGSWRNERHPEFVTDSARELFVDAGALGTAPPSLPGVGVTNDYVARLREKLFVFNAAHSICAFLGWLRGHKTIDRAVLDPFLRPMIIGCLLESRSAVLASHPKLGHDLHGPVEEALRRFANSALADPVDRVGRDPIRKLGPRDRLLGPVDLIRRVNGRVPPYFALGVAGALLFRPDGDGQACELRTTLGCEGVMSVLRHICGLEPDDPFTQAVAGRYRNFIFTPEGTIFPPAHASVPAWSAGARIVEATG
jgi:mannitol-1-phosphate 5-dehydrogenase